MPLSSPPAGIVQPRVGELVAQPANVVEPRATAMLTDAFRSGFVTADDVLKRIGDNAKTQQKLELTTMQNQLAMEQSPEMQEARQLAVKAAGARAKADTLKSEMMLENADLAKKAERAKTILDLANAESFGTFDSMKGVFMSMGAPIPMKDGVPDTAAMQAELPDIVAYSHYIRNADAVAKSIRKQKFVTKAEGKQITTEADFSDALGRPITDDERRAITDARNLDYQTWKSRGRNKSIFGGQPGAVTTDAAPAAPAAPVEDETFSIEQQSMETDAQRALRIQLFNRGDKEALSLPLSQVQARLSPQAPAPAPSAPAASVTGGQSLVEPKIAGATPGMPGIVTSIEETEDRRTRIPAEGMNKFIQVQLAVENIGDISRAYQQLKENSPNLMGVVKGRTVGPLLGEWNVFYKNLENAVNSTVPGMARGVFGEVGVLSNADIENYKKLLPTAKNDPAVAESILKEIQTKTHRAVAKFVDTYKKAGYDVGELTALQQKAESAMSGVAAPAAGAGGSAEGQTFTLSTGKKVRMDPKTGQWVTVP